MSPNDDVQRTGISLTSLSSVIDQLDRVTTPEGIQASDWDLFRGAVFGRDSAQVGLDIAPWFAHRALAIVVTLAARRGRRHDPHTEEEPGRIHHEWRSEWIGSTRASDRAREKLAELREVWGYADRVDLTYYGAVDATCLFVLLVQRVVAQLGTDVLHTEVRHLDGSVATLGQSVVEAAEWIDARIATSPLGLLEFLRTNPKGLRWQVLRDGSNSYQHADGSLANSDDPISSLEVQGLAYDALRAASELLGGRASTRWEETAERVRAATFDLMAAPTPSGFCMAIDRHPGSGALRQLLVASTLAGELLDTGLLTHQRTDGEVQAHIEPIVRELFSDEFMTVFGLRARGRSHRAALEPEPYAAYQGSVATWPVMTNIVSRGLRRCGLPLLAADLETRILAGIAHSDGFAEGWLVDEDGAVEPGAGTTGERAEETVLATSVRFEFAQAWTVSAAVRSRLLQGVLAAEAPSGWRRELERSCLDAVRDVTLEAVPRRNFVLDIPRAHRVERALLDRS